MSPHGHCIYCAQRGEAYWCSLKKTAITEEEYRAHCSFGAEIRCPLRQDLTLSELARRRIAASRLMQKRQGDVQG